MCKKLVFGIPLLLILLIGGGLLYLNFNLNALVKAAIEKYGSQVTLTDVSVSNVDISLRDGTGSVSGFKIGNPHSFVSAKAVDMDSMTLVLDTKTITGTGPLVIKKITVEAPQIDYEVDAKGNDNVRTLQRNISSFSRRRPGAEKSNAQKKMSRNVIIKDLYINRGKITATHALLKGEVIEAELSPIHMTNIGSGKGIPPEQVAKIVLNEVVNNAAKSSKAAVAKEKIYNKIDDAVGKETGGAVKNLVEDLF